MNRSNNEPTILRYYMIGAFAIAFIIVIGVKQVKANKVTCQSFKTYETAYKLFQSNPEKYKSLDRDSDGKPCEHLQ